MKKVILLILIFILSACSSTTDSIQTAIAQTQAAMQPTGTPVTLTFTPIPTNTPVPLKDVKLESLVFQPGDLPDSFKQLDVLYKPRMFSADQMKLMINAVQVPFSHNDDPAAGSVVVALFDSTFNRNQIYSDMLNDRFSGPPDPIILTNLGEKGVQIDVNILFMRCSYLVYIVAERYPDYGQDDALNYAKIIDKRLSSLICK